MGMGGQCHAPAALPPGRRPGAHCIGGCVGAEDLAPTGIRFPDRPAITSFYTDYAIVACLHVMLLVICESRKNWSTKGRTSLRI